MHSSSNSRGKRKAYIIESDDDDDDYADADTPPTPAAVAAATAQPGKTQYPHSRKSHIIKSSNAKQIQNALTVWFLDGVHDARGMPWRKRWDPALSAEAKAQRAYEVWVSEIMLQQTRVETVIPYYRKWMDAFPTVRDLAASNIEAVNALWKGLGYYSRAARLFEGAKLVVEKFDGKLPDDAALLQSDVPGIGKYSAGAICSIAYGKCVPVLDGNVHRLLSRVLALHASPKAKQVTNLLWDAAEAIVEDASDPGAVNQALIELGSTICTPKDPKCNKCPISSHCNAYKWQTGKTPTTDIEDLCEVCDPIEDTSKSVTIFPMKLEKKAVPEETDVVCAIAWRPKDDPTTYYLLRKRPATGLLAGLWDFPAVTDVGTSNASELEEHARTLVHSAIPQTHKKDGKLGIKSCRSMGSVLHIFSHVKKTFQVVLVQLDDSSQSQEPPSATPGQWMDDVPSSDGTGRSTKKRKTVPQEEEDTPQESRLKWVLEANVAQENLGTGTMKVWKVVQGLEEETKKSGARGKPKAKSSKAAAAGSTSSTPSITSFFQKVQPPGS